MISVKNVLVALAVAFTAYLAARGLWWTEPVVAPLVIVATLGLYLLTTLLCVVWEPRRARGVDDDDAESDGVPAETAVTDAETAEPGTATEPARAAAPLPMAAQVLALVCAVLVPSAVAYAVGPDARTAPFATWYLGGIGALMTIVMVRRRPWTAWVGTALLAIASMVWIGPAAALALGLVGSIVWVGVAQLLVWSLDRAERDTARLAGLQRAASAWQASQLARRRERRVRVQQALTAAGPVLSRAIAQGGTLTAEDRLEARLAEGRLRDEMRGPRLLDDEVRGELERARRRGAHVTVLDEGGLEGIDESDLSVIRGQLAETLRTAASERLYIRTSPDARVAVTVVGRSTAVGGGHSDEDEVDLWREIAHPGAA
ncbi:hypothetical protein JOD63_001963 [Microbacterium terrae]|uniref:Uncharacterized protein n=1 Tax=Microbacterium terrae TaxID=69369 RepID=A0A0M2HAM4_9MICO|nr:hypothetical protein [Microbacterium terrae]KJL41714.1 hypothetical protein RS81_01299 [Microbacterium terrae]MBP1077995.1 hypothetical protein [Microbacterium terrae]